MAYIQRLVRASLGVWFVLVGLQAAGCAKSHARAERDAAVDIASDTRPRDVLTDLRVRDSRMDIELLDAGNDAPDVGPRDTGPDVPPTDAGPDAPDGGFCERPPVPTACHGTYERGTRLVIDGHLMNVGESMVRTPTGWAWLAWAPSHESYNVVRAPLDLSSLSAVPLEGVPWMHEGRAYRLGIPPTVRNVRSTGEWLIRLATREESEPLIGLWDVEGNLLVTPRLFPGWVGGGGPLGTTETGYEAIDLRDLSKIRTAHIDLALNVTRGVTRGDGPINRAGSVWRGCDWLLWGELRDGSGHVFWRLGVDGTLTEPIRMRGVSLPPGAMAYSIRLFETGPALLVAHMPNRGQQMLAVDPQTGEALGEFVTIFEPSEGAVIFSGGGPIVREGDRGYGLIYQEAFHLTGKQWLVRFDEGEVVQRILLAETTVGAGTFQLQWRDNAYVVGYRERNAVLERLSCVP